MNTYTAKFLITVAIASFLIGLGAGWILFRDDKTAESTSIITSDKTTLNDTMPNTEVKSVTPPVTENSIAVSDQPAGSTVRILLVSLIQDGWVVIHEDQDGRPGNILGAQRFTAGSHPEGGEVELLRWTEAGNIYYAMLHSDDNGRSFDHTIDLPLVDEDEKIIMVKFTAL